MSKPIAITESCFVFALKELGLAAWSITFFGFVIWGNIQFWRIFI